MLTWNKVNCTTADGKPIYCPYPKYTPYNERTGLTTYYSLCEGCQRGDWKASNRKASAKRRTPTRCCVNCHIEKPIELFVRRGRGYDYHCLKCGVKYPFKERGKREEKVVIINKDDLTIVFAGYPNDPRTFRNEAMFKAVIAECKRRRYTVKKDTEL